MTRAEYLEDPFFYASKTSDKHRVFVTGESGEVVKVIGGHLNHRQPSFAVTVEAVEKPLSDWLRCAELCLHQARPKLRAANRVSHREQLSRRASNERSVKL